MRVLIVFMDFTTNVSKHFQIVKFEICVGSIVTLISNFRDVIADSNFLVFIPLHRYEVDLLC